MKKLILISGLLICMNGLSEEIIESNLHRHINVLASDEFEGRSPGSEGGEKTKKYLKNEFKRLGLTPIQNNYYLEVPLSRMTVNINDSFLSISDNEKKRVLQAGPETVFWTRELIKKFLLRQVN